MKQVLSAMVGVAGLVSVVGAEVNTRVDVLLSVNGGPLTTHAPWPGGAGQATIEVVVRMTYIGTANPLGLASAVFQPTVSGMHATDTPLGFVNGGAGSNTSTPLGVVPDAAGQFGRISPFGRTSFSTAQALTNHLHTGGSGGAPAGNWLRIAQRTATSWIGGTGNTTGGQGVNIAQLSSVGRTASDPAFNPSLSVNVFRYGLVIDTSSGGERSMVFDIAINSFGNYNSLTGERQVYWWGDMNESTGSIRGTATVNQAYLTVPAPTAGLMVLAGLGATARRRRSAARNHI